MDCKLHFDKFYTEDSRGDFSSIMIDHNNSTEAMRVDEPITCTNAAQDIPIAHSAGPTRPTAGSITFKGTADFLLQIVNGMLLPYLRNFAPAFQKEILVRNFSDLSHFIGYWFINTYTKGT